MATTKARYWWAVVGYNGTLERYCRGNYLKKKAADESMKKSANEGGTVPRERICVALVRRFRNWRGGQLGMMLD